MAERVAHLSYQLTTPYTRQVKHIYVLCEDEDAATMLALYVQDNPFFPNVEHVTYLKEELQKTMEAGYDFDEAGVEPEGDENKKYCMLNYALSFIE